MRTSLISVIPSWCLVLLAATPGAAEAQGVSGVVVDQATAQPIEGAIVTLQATTERTVTLANGTFDLPGAQGSAMVIVAAKKGFFNVSTTVNGPTAGLTLELEAVVVGDNPNYSFIDAQTCGSCHPDQLSQWAGSPMNKAGANTWLYDIYDGTGSAGGMGGFVYTRDSIHAASNPHSECASCHQPEPWIEQPHKALDPIGALSPGSMHGISCEVCHKIADADPAFMNFPGIYPGGGVSFNRPDDPLVTHQVQYGALGDTSFTLPTIMRPSYNPEIVAETCGVCHQDKNDPDGNGNFEEPNGVVSEPTYWEWRNSEYADPASEHYATCVTCHMPAYGSMFASTSGGSPQRDPETIRSHLIEGTTAQYLENAAEVTVDAVRTLGAIDVDVTVFNKFTGHHLPTGVTVRNMILVVEAVRTSDNQALTSIGAQAVHDLGGVGDPAQGYYAGLPGKFYAKVNHDINGNGPTFFTDAVGISFDSRIPALESDTTHYRFAAPSGTGEVEVRARLIYRRAFRFLVDAKQWTTDGHGNPLEEIQAPHFGHLMEDVTARAQDFGPGRPFCNTSANSTGAPARMGATGSASISSNDLTLIASNVPSPTLGLFLFGRGMDNTPLGNGTNCIGNTIGRYTVLPPSLGNVVHQPVDLNQMPNGHTVQPGETLYFQYIYRDVDARGAGFDLTDGYSITFTL